MSGFVQKSALASGTTSAAPSLSGTTAGNLAVLCVSWDGTGNTPGIPSGWSAATQGSPNGTGQTGAAIFYILSIAGGTLSVTVSVTGAADTYADISEYNSAAAWVFGAGSAGNNGNVGTTSVTTGTITPPQANSLIVTSLGGSGNTNSDTITPSTTGPATNQLNRNTTGATTMDFNSQYQFSTTVTGFTDTWTTQSMFLGFGTATFKYTPASAGTAVPIPSMIIVGP